MRMRMGGLNTTGTCTPPLVWYQQQQQQPHHLFFLHHLPESSRCRRSRQQPIPIRCAAPANERQALFNRISPVYDNLNDLFSLGQHRIWKRMAVSWTNAKRGNSVLDLCCGSGDLAFLLSEKVGFEGQVIGLDFSTQQLLVASSRKDLCFKTCYNNIVWVQGDALDLPYPDNRFDAITVGYGLRNVVDKPKAMKEIFRVLKPGSKASILDFNKSTEPFVTSLQEWMIDNVVIPVASSYGLAKEYEYLKSSIREFLTGKELEKLALETGFVSAKHYEIGGLMGNLVEADKIGLAETMGLDQKQINNWFINQRRRHWKPSENMKFAVMDSLLAPFYVDD